MKRTLLNGVTRDRLIREDKSSTELLKPYLRGRDIRRWQVSSQDLWLIFVPWHFPLHEDVSIKGASVKAEKEFAKRYPSIYKHLTSFKKELLLRKPYETGIRYEWYALQRWGADYWEEYEKPKIIYPDIYAHQSFAWDEEGFYLATASYFIPTEEKWLTAVLNSSLIEWYYSQISNKLRGGYLRAFSDYMRQVPIPPAEDWQKEIIEKLVDYTIFLTKADGEKLVVNYFESIINALVYELFLTEELHAADKRFFEPLRKENLPLLSQHVGNEPQVIRELFERLSDVNHPVRHNLYLLSNLESVRIIEGK